MTGQNTKRRPISKFNVGFSTVSSLFLLALFIKNAEIASTEVLKSLKMCATMLIPSLFPLTVASEIATETGAIERLTRHFQLPIAKILGVSRNATAPYFLGLLGGYTSSCKSAVLLLEKGDISRSDCESIIALSAMPSLAFLGGFVGGSVFKSSTVGWALWAVTVISTFIIGTVNKLFNKKIKVPKGNVDHFYSHGCKKSFSRIAVDAIAHSAQAMLTICGCVVFFSVLIAVLEQALKACGVTDTIRESLLGLLEITRGVSSSALIESESARASLCALYIGWSGLSVHFQIISLCEGAHLSYKRYFLLKALQGVICALLFYGVFYFIKV